VAWWCGSPLRLAAAGRDGLARLLLVLLVLLMVVLVLLRGVLPGWLGWRVMSIDADERQG
jgi:hypothetical protein